MQLPKGAIRRIGEPRLGGGDKMIFRCLLMLLALIFAGPVRAGPSDISPASEKRLQSYLAKQLPPRGLSLECVFWIVEESTAKYIEYAVREKHGGSCPGDPAVSPIVDRYRVPAGKGRIQTYDPIEDRWR
ncbi:MAG TPA: hypothetical protein VFW62_03240 [bacterium]|nr:hypothetical protein [bacterium]